VRKKAEQRVYKAHSRFRDEMHAAIDRAERAGRLSAHAARFRRECLRYLYRGGVGGVVDEPERGTR
jgi:hypothetical protein